MTDLLQYIWPATVLIIFGGMLALCWRALSIAHDLASIVLKAGLPLPTTVPSIVAPTKPTVQVPTTTSPAVPTTPSDAVTPGLIAFIKKAEGFQPKAYWDYKQYSIGYGTKANSAAEVITEAEGTQRLTDEVHKADKLVTDKFPNLPLGQHQALLDLTYNAGPGWEEGSLGHAVANQKIETIKADILLYNHAGGVVNAGLTARREAEVSWFDHPL